MKTITLIISCVILLSGCQPYPDTLETPIPSKAIVISGNNDKHLFMYLDEGNWTMISRDKTNIRRGQISNAVLEETFSEMKDLSATSIKNKIKAIPGLSEEFLNMIIVVLGTRSLLEKDNKGVRDLVFHYSLLLLYKKDMIYTPDSFDFNSSSIESKIIYSMKYKDYIVKIEIPRVLFEVRSMME